MSSTDKQAGRVDLSHYRLQKDNSPTGHRLRWRYASKQYPATYTYVQPIARSRRPMSWIQVGMAIAGGIFLLPLLIGAPLLIAVALGRHYPFFY